MSKGTVNKVILLGNVGIEPDVKYSQSGVAVLNLSLATTETWKDKETGENKDKTEWHKIVLYRKLAEIAGEYLHKGSKIYVEGKLQTRKWQDKEGLDRYTTEIVADNFQMLSGKSDVKEHEVVKDDSYKKAKEGNKSAIMPQPTTPIFDDEIPF